MPMRHFQDFPKFCVKLPINSSCHVFANYPGLPLAEARKVVVGLYGQVASDCLLSGSDPVEAIELENGVPVDDVLRSVNSSHGAFESLLVHTLGLCNDAGRRN
jgi:hypothetical protein